MRLRFLASENRRPDQFTVSSSKIPGDYFCFLLSLKQCFLEINHLGACVLHNVMCFHLVVGLLHTKVGYTFSFPLFI